MAFSAQAQRESADPTGPWKFIKQDVAPDAAFDAWTDVTVPHTWNNLDGQNGKGDGGYYRGPGWYARKLDVPANWAGRRIFLRFDAASLVADVYLNGQHLGQHRGGFGAFAYEVTGIAKPGAENVLRVKVDNTKVEDVPPLSGDFTVFGGLYRPVHLFSTDATCITPLDHGSSGVLLTQKSVSPSQAMVQVDTKISSNLAASAPVTVAVDLVDAAGKVVQTASVQGQVPPNTTVPVSVPLPIKAPHLWNGRIDPYLYQVRVKVQRDGKDVDEVTQPLGIRTVQITDAQGFLLNGKPYPIHGVNRHQEVMDKGWALTPEDNEADFKMMADMGVTAIRLAHYPQSDNVHDIADRLGILLWQEIPIVEQIRDTPAFTANVTQQLEEMILQGYNHPSIAFWGIFNELNASWVKFKHPDAVPLLTSLRDLAHKLDPSRPVVAAAFTADPQPIQLVPDWTSVNNYPGWYWGKSEQLADSIKKAANSFKKKRLAVSEYGAGANPDQHQEGKITKAPNAGGGFHPEEYQTYQHEIQYAQIKDNPLVWGSFVWAMFDFASDGRSEGGSTGINDKGLVSHDRKTKKDAYFFYQANWSPQPMVYIASRRSTPRKQSNTPVEVFTNSPAGAELIVNGKSLGTAKPDKVSVCRWPSVQLQPGENKIEARAIVGGKPVTDACEWTVGG